MSIRLNKAIRKLNIGLLTAVEFLEKKSHLGEVRADLSFKLNDDQYNALREQFQKDKEVRTQDEMQLQKHPKEEKELAEPQKVNILPPNKKKDTKNTIIGVNDDSLAKRVKQSVLQYKNHKLYTIRLSQLRFEEGYITYSNEKGTFVFHHLGFTSNMNKYKNDLRIRSISTQIKIDISKGKFSFVDSKILQQLDEIIKKIDNEAFEKHLKEYERNKAKKEIQNEEIKKNKQKIEHEIQFYKLIFGNKKVSLIYKKRRYVYRDYNIKAYDKILKQIYSRVSKTRENDIKTSFIRVEIDIESQTFKFINVDINKYIKNLKDTFLPQGKKDESHNVILSKNGDVSPQPMPSLNTMTLNSGNIHFYNGYFLIFLTANGEIDNSVAPYRVNDADSYEILNLVHRYFEQRFEQMRIKVKYDEKQILRPSNLEIFQLRNYVKALGRNLDVKGDWWEEVQNARKRTFGQCFGESKEFVKSRYVRSKNEYLYNLSSLQNEKKLIRVYEINHGREEDAFIFSIDMPGNRNAIIFENASNEASTTTWLFVALNENYDESVNLIFDYFTDYTISSKRSSLRVQNINPPEKFKAESYYFIDHDDLEQWLKKLNSIIEGESKPSEIKFEPGLRIPQSSEIRYRHIDAISTRNLHNQLMVKLYDRLCCESGQENVGTEIRIGTKRIDAVVKGENCFDIYEVKTAPDSFDCVTEALGQICQYAYLYCPDRIGKMVIVGASIASKEVEEYLSWFRKKHSMKVYYMQVPL